jgi:glycosyltransferase involved in cell wall biosynthesis
MVISLIHPSRGRSLKAIETASTWIDLAGIQVEHVLSLDESDPSLSKYQREFHGWNIIVNNNTSVVEATNRAAKHATGDILLYLSDDFSAFENWGLSVLKEFEGEDRPLLLKVDDCLQKFEVPVLTIPMMNRKLYEKLGYFWHPEYKSMFVDCDLFETVKKMGALKNAKHLKFEHQHVSVGKAPDDETYRNSAKNWEQGKALFAKRKAMGFPV